jgi:hypothetical protein
MQLIGAGGFHVSSRQFMLSLVEGPDRFKNTNKIQRGPKNVCVL